MSNSMAIAELEAKINSLTQEKRDMQATIADLNIRVVSMDAENARLTGANRNMQKEIASMKSNTNIPNESIEWNVTLQAELDSLRIKSVSTHIISFNCNNYSHPLFNNHSVDSASARRRWLYSSGNSTISQPKTNSFVPLPSHPSSPKATHTPASKTSSNTSATERRTRTSRTSRTPSRFRSLGSADCRCPATNPPRW